MKNKKNKNTKVKQSGFSLIEILVVLLIIGLLSTLVAVNVLPSQDRAKFEKAKAMNDLVTTSQYDKDCKKPCCKGCMATDTIGLAIACLADHSCCNPNFK